ncbi:M20/M25/M40 family metallo-hydrolase [Actinoplanes sp. NPDC048791]|uniref:M20/M25/M40 family metallo-hydrolase n=1 Tax=Actinoplanes sp. NPDC048791 TaxID=3154623 RepID=UPI00340CE966
MRVAELMPGLVEDLKRLTSIPSVASAGFPAEPLLAAHDFVIDRLRDAGVVAIESLTIEGKTAPVVVAEVAAPPGAPTVLLYTHYDVVPAGDESLWHTPPFEAVEKDGALYGRGTADSKANVMSIIGALKVFGGRPPVGVKVIIEGQEEVGSPFDTYPPSAPELFRADAMIIADVGSVRPGTPTLTVALRGSAQVDVEIRTLAGDKHSGQYGGAAPDARIAMIHLLASLHDAQGDVVVPGLRRTEWTGATYTDEEFRELAEIEPGTATMGTGGLGERIWSGPAVTVIALDAPSTAAPMNAVAAFCRAVLNLRVHPEQDAAEAQAALVRFLSAQRPFGIEAVVTAGETGNGFAATLNGPGYDAATAALRAAWNAEPQTMAGGGSIPLVMALHQAVPAAEMLLFGATDSYANIHAPNERVLLDEFAKAVLAKATFFVEYARRAGGAP